jgi:hypothetical protein
LETSFKENELEDILYTSKKDVITVMKNSLISLIKEHPLICLGFTFAIGVALGNILAEANKK